MIDYVDNLQLRGPAGSHIDRFSVFDIASTKAKTLASTSSDEQHAIVAAPMHL